MARNPVIPTSIGKQAVADFQQTLERIMSLKYQSEQNSINQANREEDIKRRAGEREEEIAYRNKRDNITDTRNYEKTFLSLVDTANEYLNLETGNFETAYQRDQYKLVMKQALDFAENKGLTAQHNAYSPRISDDWLSSKSAGLNKFIEFKDNITNINPAVRESGENLIFDINNSLANSEITPSQFTKLQQLTTSKIASQGPYVWGDFAPTSGALKQAMTAVGTAAASYTSNTWDGLSEASKNSALSNYSGTVGDPVIGTQNKMSVRNDVFQQFGGDLIKKDLTSDKTISIQSSKYYDKMSLITGKPAHRLYWEDQNSSLEITSAKAFQDTWLSNFSGFDKPGAQKWAMGELPKNVLENVYIPKLIQSLKITNPEWHNPENGAISEDMINHMVEVYEVPMASLKEMTSESPAGGPSGKSGTGEKKILDQTLIDNKTESLHKEIVSDSNKIYGKKLTESEEVSFSKKIRDVQSLNPDHPFFSAIKFTEKDEPYISGEGFVWAQKLYDLPNSTVWKGRASVIRGRLADLKRWPGINEPVKATDSVNLKIKKNQYRRLNERILKPVHTGSMAGVWQTNPEIRDIVLSGQDPSKAYKPTTSEGHQSLRRFYDTKLYLTPELLNHISRKELEGSPEIERVLTDAR